MEISKVEVFECHKCGKISKEQGDIISCLKKHGKEEIQGEESIPYRELNDNVVNFMIRNLHSLKLADVGEQLTAACKLIGINLNISRIAGGRHEIDDRDKHREYISYKIDGSCSRIHETEFKKISLPKHLKGNLNHYFEILIDPKEYVSFGRICELLAGVSIQGGGGGGNTFNYDIKLWLDAFPELNNKWQALKELRLKKKKYVAEKNRLTEDYEKHRKPVVLISDIKYQAIKSEFDEIKEQIESLRVKSAELGTKVNSRVNELFYKDSPAYTTPDLSFEFDSNMEQELTQDLGV